MGEARWLTEDAEAKALYRAVLPKRWRYLNLFVRIGLGTGARHEAILSLTWDRVDLETGYLDFRLPDREETKEKRSHAEAVELLGGDVPDGVGAPSDWGRGFHLSAE
jgi:integrase